MALLDGVIVGVLLNVKGSGATDAAVTGVGEKVGGEASGFRSLFVNKYIDGFPFFIHCIRKVSRHPHTWRAQNN